MSREYSNVKNHAFHRIIWYWIAEHVGPPPSQPFGLKPIIHDSALTEDTQIIKALLIGMTDALGPGSFPREKIAILEDGTLMLVLMCARKGDSVC
jgi:hypothetical protein